MGSSFERFGVKFILRLIVKVKVANKVRYIVKVKYILRFVRSK